MCLIAFSKDGKSKIPMDNMEFAQRRNSDGWGIMFAQNGRLAFIKENTSFKQFRDIWETMIPDNVPVGVHFRMATSGAKNDEMCHPFRILNKEQDEMDLALMHNGVISIKSMNPGVEKRSDTALFVDAYLRPMLRKGNSLIQSRAFNLGLSMAIGTSNKLVMLDGDGNDYWVHKNQGVEIDGVWYSNEYSLPSKKSQTSTHHYHGRGDYSQRGRFDGQVWNRETNSWEYPSYDKRSVNEGANGGASNGESTTTSSASGSPQGSVTLVPKGNTANTNTPSTIVPITKSGGTLIGGSGFYPTGETPLTWDPTIANNLGIVTQVKNVIWPRGWIRDQKKTVTTVRMDVVEYDKRVETMRVIIKERMAKQAERSSKRTATQTGTTPGGSTGTTTGTGNVPATGEASKPGDTTGVPAETKVNEALESTEVVTENFGGGFCGLPPGLKGVQGETPEKIPSGISDKIPFEIKDKGPGDSFAYKMTMRNLNSMSKNEILQWVMDSPEEAAYYMATNGFSGNVMSISVWLNAPNTKNIDTAVDFIFARSRGFMVNASRIQGQVENEIIKDGVSQVMQALG